MVLRSLPRSGSFGPAHQTCRFASLQSFLESWSALLRLPLPRAARCCVSSSRAQRVLPPRPFLQTSRWRVHRCLWVHPLNSWYFLREEAALLKLSSHFPR